MSKLVGSSNGVSTIDDGVDSSNSGPTHIQPDHDAVFEQNRELGEALERMARRVEQLETRLGGSSGPGGVDADQPAPRSDLVSRRGLLLAAGAAGIVAATGGLVIARPSVAGAATQSGYGLTQTMLNFQNSPGNFGPIVWEYDTSLSPPPLIDSAVIITRNDPASVTAGRVNTVLGLFSDNSQRNSYAWALYVEVRATTSSSATEASSQSAGVVVRSYNRSTGATWVSTVHSEPHHGEDQNQNSVIAANGTTIGVNCELNRQTTAGSAYGYHVENVPRSTANGDAGLQITSSPRSGGGVNGWTDGIRFAGTGSGDGNIAINMQQASYAMGIDLAANSLRLAAGQKIYLESTGTTWLSYNPSTHNIELYKNNVLVKSW